MGVLASAEADHKIRMAIRVTTVIGGQTQVALKVASICGRPRAEIDRVEAPASFVACKRPREPECRFAYLLEVLGYLTQKIDSDVAGQPVVFGQEDFDATSSFEEEVPLTVELSICEAEQ